MRVIAGSARRLQLKTLEGIETRPTTDRIKETLFNIDVYKRQIKSYGKEIFWYKKCQYKYQDIAQD